ncbi:MAG TPA: zinc ribbon domain-containing protein [Tepidisphaeraceae bacterium]
MPIYEYECKQCGARFEKLVRTMTSSAEPAKCPTCESDNTARALSVFAAVSSEGSGKSPAGGNLPMCGRCGGPGPCAME